jgi:hypothetical protein
MLRLKRWRTRLLVGYGRSVLLRAQTTCCRLDIGPWSSLDGHSSAGRLAGVGGACRRPTCTIGVGWAIVAIGAFGHVLIVVLITVIFSFLVRSLFVSCVLFCCCRCCCRRRGRVLARRRPNLVSHGDERRLVRLVLCLAAARLGGGGASWRLGRGRLKTAGGHCVRCGDCVDLLMKRARLLALRDELDETFQR